MARALRITEPGLWHHITNRGLGGAAIFVDDADREAFLERVAECAGRWQVRTAAYVLLDGRFHLLVHDRNGALSRAMRHVTGVYTQAFNRRHDREGPLLRGRFRDRVVQHGSFLLQVVRHLHTLPVREGQVRRVGDYAWSSHRLYLSPERPEWLAARAVLALIDGDTPAGQRAFDAYVDENVDPAAREALDGSPWQPILGDPDYVDGWRHRLRQDERYADLEIPDARRLRAWTVDEVIGAACEAFGLDVASLMASARGRLNLPRMVCMMVCRDRSGASLREIGDRFGVSPGAVSALASRTRARLREDAAGEALEQSLLERLSRPPERPIRHDPTGLRDHIGRIAE